MTNQEDAWPVPKFYFKVRIGDKGDIAFQEVSGLDAEHDELEYCAGNSLLFSTVKMPGLLHGDITFKKGVFKDDTTLLDYFMKIQMNTIQRETVIIQLLDEEHAPMFTWTLKNAYPLKLNSITMNAQSSEVAIEELVLVHEGISVDKS